MGLVTFQVLDMFMPTHCEINNFVNVLKLYLFTIIILFHARKIIILPYIQLVLRYLPESIIGIF